MTYDNDRLIELAVADYRLNSTEEMWASELLNVIFTYIEGISSRKSSWSWPMPEVILCLEIIGDE